MSAIPEGWKLVPANVTQEWEERLSEIGYSRSNVIASVLSAAPQPPVSNAKQGSQAEQVDSLRTLFVDALSWGMVYGPLMTSDEWDRRRNEAAEKYVQMAPQPTKREPLTDEQLFASDEIMSLNADLGWRMDTIRMFARAIERAHGIGGEA